MPKNGGLLSGTPVYHLVHQLNINTLTGKMPLEEGHNLMCGINSGQLGIFTNKLFFYMDI